MVPEKQMEGQASYKPQVRKLVDPAKGVFGALGRAAESYLARQVDKLAESLLVEAGPCVVLGRSSWR